MTQFGCLAFTKSKKARERLDVCFIVCIFKQCVSLLKSQKMCLGEKNAVWDNKLGRGCWRVNYRASNVSVQSHIVASRTVGKHCIVDVLFFCSGSVLCFYVLLLLVIS